MGLCHGLNRSYGHDHSLGSLSKQTKPVCCMRQVLQQHTLRWIAAETFVRLACVTYRFTCTCSNLGPRATMAPGQALWGRCGTPIELKRIKAIVDDVSKQRMASTRRDQVNRPQVGVSARAVCPMRFSYVLIRLTEDHPCWWIGVTVARAPLTARCARAGALPNCERLQRTQPLASTSDACPWRPLCCLADAADCGPCNTAICPRAAPARANDVAR